MLPPHTLMKSSSTNHSSRYNHRAATQLPSQVSLIHSTPDPPKYPILTQFGISTDYSKPETAYVINAMIKELEQLGKEHNLEVVRENNTKAAILFLPLQLSSKKSFDKWARKKTGMNSIFKYIR